MIGTVTKMSGLGLELSRSLLKEAVAANSAPTAEAALKPH
jgi:hypothetical protein